MEVNITKLDHFGRGITYINDKICFINFCIPGEIVDIKIVKNKKKYLEGKIVKFIKYSDKRVKSKCPYFNECGGCDLRHMNILLQKEFKENKLKEILKKFANIDESKIKDIIKLNKDNYRNKVVFHIKNRKLGFYKRKSHDLVEIDNCLNLDNRINEIIPNLKKLIKEKNNNIKSITVRVGNKTNDMLISIEGEVKNNHYISNINNQKIISIIKDKKYIVTKDDFFQVNEYLTEYLYDEIVKNVKELKSKNVLDLYCGTGTIGIYIKDFVKTVTGIEVVKSSIISANKNKELNKIQNIDFKEGKAEEIYPKLIEKFDTVICDPPRNGLNNNVINTLKKMKPENIIYISCDPVTLARDLKSLKENYEIIKITPFDMFENTYHIESVAVLKNISK